MYEWFCLVMWVRGGKQFTFVRWKSKTPIAPSEMLRNHIISLTGKKADNSKPCILSGFATEAELDAFIANPTIDPNTTDIRRT